MTVTEIWITALGGSGILILIGSLVKIKPLEINLWSWLLRKLGRAFQGELLDAIKQTNSKVDKVEEKVDELDRKMDNHERKDLEDKILAKRKDILVFADEISNRIEHSKEHFEEILSFIDDYEDYCSAHPSFENNKALIAIELIKNTYRDCLGNHKFI